MNQKLFSKDFTLVVIGQIISLFGNATIRFGSVRNCHGLRLCPGHFAVSHRRHCGG